MRKSKRKNRSRSHVNVNQDEERRKICASIMKVFQAHAESPSGEGAVLVREKLEGKRDSRSIVHQNACKQLRTVTKTGKSDSSSSDSQTKDGSNSQQQSDRYKRRKLKSCKEKLEESHSKVSQHVRAAHSYTFFTNPTTFEAQSMEPASCGGCITRSRLTRNIGLFNPGRKSSTVVRDPIPVPESVQRDVDRTLQKILDHHDEQCETGRDDSGMQDMQTPASCHKEASCLGVTSKRSKSISSDNGSISFQERPENVSIHVNLEDIFPKIVPYEDFTKGMQSELTVQLKKHFKHRDLLRETCTELKKLISENQRGTPERELIVSSPCTPQPSSVQRSLFDTFSTCSKDLKENKTRSVELVSRQVPTVDSSKRRTFSQTMHRSPFQRLSSTSRTLSAPVWMFPTEHSTTLTTSQVSEEWGRAPEELGNTNVKSCLLDSVDAAEDDSALSLLRCNALLSKLNALQSGKKEIKNLNSSSCDILLRRQGPHEGSSYSDASCDQKKYSRLLSARQQKENAGCSDMEVDVTFDTGHEQGLSPSTSVGRCHFQPQQSKALVAELNHRPQHVSNFPENSCHSHLRRGITWDDTSTRSSGCLQHEASADDRHKGSVLSSYHDVDIMDECEDKRLRKAGSFPDLLDVDSCDHDLLPTAGDSPCWPSEWKPVDILPALQKPSLDTPSPPLKLSPHKLY